MTDTSSKAPAHAAPTGDTTVYCGSYRGAGAGPGDVWLEDGRGGMVGVLQHRTGPGSHSPTGFSWGSAGSGPAELARAILIDALGEAARCTLCQGHSKVVFLPEAALDADPVPYTAELRAALDTDEVRASDNPPAVEQCWECDGTGTARVPYQDFKFAVIARLDQDDDFTLTRAEVLDWYATHQATVTAAPADA